jgi:hypothetical protein
MMGIFKQIDQRLFDLHPIEPARQRRHRRRRRKRLLAREIGEEGSPVDAFRPRCRQLRESGITADEVMQVLGPLRDGRKNLRQCRVVAAPRNLRTRVRQRRKWPQ